MLALFGNWIDFNFRSSLDVAVYIQCKLKDVQSLQSSYFLVFYHFGFETTTLTFSRIIDFENDEIQKEVCCLSGKERRRR